jgi:glycosyltransferase involved in cell wall biosynthesis
MRFSQQIAEVGRFQLRKLLELVRVIVSILYCRVRYRPDVLYYPPAGPRMVPIYRDLVILSCTRWLFRRTVFHFHACGLAGMEPRLSWWARRWFRWAYGGAHASIRSSDLIPDDGRKLGAHRDYIVPLGVDDCKSSYSVSRKQDDVPVILFAGILSADKGLLDLLNACALMAQRVQAFRLEVMGAFESAAFERQVHELCHKLEIAPKVVFLGVCAGREKHGAFSRADVLCFPSRHPTETFGLVIVEAMSYGLPVVATRWRAAPSIIEEGQTGFLVEIEDPQALAERLEQLIQSPTLRERMAMQARAQYLRRFTTRQYLREMENVFLDVAGS